MKNKSIIILCSFICAICTGCGSIMARHNGGNQVKREHVTDAKYLYPGVEYDIVGIGLAIEDKHDCHPKELAAAFHLVDTPLSAIVDTVLLPYDLYMVTFGGQTRDGKNKPKTLNH